MSTYKNFTVETDADGIALVTWDMPDNEHERLHRRGDG